MDLDKAMELQKGRMVHVNLRLPSEVVEFYKKYNNYSAAMRHVLAQYVYEAKAEDEEKNNDVSFY
jgi:hypothetical protein|tara:strand:- start:348 stop:542 length:195 start_codon:yes stop_codon:yes gene_type:complete